MAAIRGINTRPELIVRRALHARGFRYRLHVKGMPGKPDLVFPKYRAVIFVHGCFWHGHDCALFKWPKTREQFWYDKISVNRSRDVAACRNLRLTGWRVATVWECALKGRRRIPVSEMIDLISLWLFSDSVEFSVRGR